MRWIVGDIQGCLREFEQLLQTIRFDPAEDELWCLGDLINRGPDSLGVLRLWREMGGNSLLGNHEVNTLLVHSGSIPRKRNDTLEALYGAPDADRWFSLLRALPVLVHLPSEGAGRDAWIVHAGLDPSWAGLHAVAARIESRPHDDDWLQSPEVSCATRIRCCTAEGDRSRFTGPPEECPPQFRPWNEFYRGGDLVVHGHWAMRGFYREGNVIGLDSGCVYGGALSAWCQEEDRVVQVDAAG